MNVFCMIILPQQQTNNRLKKFKERFQAKKESAFQPETGFARICIFELATLLSKAGTPQKRDL
jgi:hypothetical protein